MVERWTKTKRHEVCEHPPSNPHLQKRDNKHEFFIGIIHIKIYDLPMCISNTRDIEPFIPSLRILHRSITNHSNWSLNRHTYEIIVHICLYIKSKNTVVLNDRVKKKKKVLEGTTNKKRSVREASSSPPCSSSKDPLSKVFRDLRVFLEESQTITKSSIGEILSGTSGGFRSLFRIEIKSVTSACDSAEKKNGNGVGSRSRSVEEEWRGVERAAERMYKV